MIGLRQFVVFVLLWATAFFAPNATSWAGERASSWSAESGRPAVGRARFEDGTIILNKDADRCTVLSPDGMRQRIIDVAIRAWTAFGEPSLDLTKAPKSIRGFPAPQAPEPGRDAGPKQLAMIAGFWAVAPRGLEHIEEQNRRWMLRRNEEWRDHWSAAFISWVMCEAGLNEAQFARSVRHLEYVRYALTHPESVFGLLPTNTPPAPGDLLCAIEDGLPGRQFDEGHIEVLAGRRLHCYVVVSSGKGKTFVIGGNVINWSKTPPEEYGGVGLLILDNASIVARGLATSCTANKPCWLLALNLKRNETVTYANIALTSEARALLEGNKNGF
jgi:hypothetical protein